MLMRVGKCFDRTDSLGDNPVYLRYSGLREWFNEVVEGIQGLKNSGRLPKALEPIDDRLRLQITTDPCPENAGDGGSLTRRGLPEAFSTCSAGLHRVRERCRWGPRIILPRGFANPTTGLPSQMDLIDEDMALERDWPPSWSLGRS